METKVGQVTHFYGKLGVGIVKLSAPVKAGDTLHFLGSSTDFTQAAGSLQVNHQNVEQGKKGEEVGIKVDQRVREGDEVYLVRE
ncbi:MAG: hypothetical protein HYW80_01285 [Parcubacteria group bacterium]|nr:hypothetical protein [Parcubacteria group bacterium]